MSTRTTAPVICLAALALVAPARAQNTTTTLPPIIDVHFHAMDESGPNAQPMCPNTAAFTASDPKDKEAAFGWVQEECSPKLYPSKPGEYLKDIVAEMERLNVTAVVFGSPEQVKKWQEAAPGRVIPGAPFESAGKRLPIDHQAGDVDVDVRVGLQHGQHVVGM